MKLTEEEAPWAFERGLPARSISALELLATCVGLILLVPPEKSGRGTITASSLSDSQVASAVASKGMTTAFPLCALNMELAAQCEARSLDLDVAWVPRDQNQEADRLAAVSGVLLRTLRA